MTDELKLDIEILKKFCLEVKKKAVDEQDYSTAWWIREAENALSGAIKENSEQWLKALEGRKKERVIIDYFGEKSKVENTRK